jgi:S-formylglutathione hydrolase
VFYLAGLTCTEETFMAKAGAQRVAAREGLILITPDTSPRGANLPGENDSWDLGTGAGFYVDATEQPWLRHYRMYSYIVNELRELVIDLLRLDSQRIGIMGHSMGGHGALTLALRHPERFKSVSAFAPIAAPAQCPWGRPPCQNCCRLNRTKNLGAMKEERIGTVRTGIQGKSSSTIVAA